MGEKVFNWETIKTAFLLFIALAITVSAIIFALTFSQNDVSNQKLCEYFCGLQNGTLTDYQGGNKITCSINQNFGYYNITTDVHYALNITKVKEMYLQNITGGK